MLGRVRNENLTVWAVLRFRLCLYHTEAYRSTTTGPEEFLDGVPKSWHEDPVDHRITARVNRSHEHVNPLKSDMNNCLSIH